MRNNYETLFSDKEKEYVDKWFLDHDESWKWPIKGEFNATEKALKYIKEVVEKSNGIYVNPVEYAYAIDGALRELVNSSLSGE